MEIIDKKEFARTDKSDFEKEKDEEDLLTESKFQELLQDIQDPVKAQQNLAVRIKHSLDKRIANEMQKNGLLGENTRKWVESYNNILEKLQKAMFGEKSVNLNIHKISHSDIATKIRETQKKWEK